MPKKNQAPTTMNASTMVSRNEPAEDNRSSIKGQKKSTTSAEMKTEESFFKHGQNKTTLQR
jgi:hypothetical protein